MLFALTKNVSKRNNTGFGLWRRSMAKVYGKASRVIIWLGERANNSNVALEAIRAAGKPTNTSNKEMIQQAILPLLQRPWFRRIWVRQQTFDNISRNC